MAGERAEDDVHDSAVPLFVAQGSRDDTTLAADLFALEAIRQQPKRPLRYVVVEQGDHAFETPDRKSHLAELFDDFLTWALDPGRQTSLGTLNTNGLVHSGTTCGAVIFTPHGRPDAA